MNEIKLCGVVLCALIVCVVSKNIKNEYSLFIRIALTVTISCISFSIFYPILSYFEEMAINTTIYPYIPILIKALGIAFIVQITADICKDAGEGSLAERICLFGKAEILVISLPLIKNLFKLCEEIIK